MKSINPFPKSPNVPSVINERAFLVTESLSLSQRVRGSEEGGFAVEIFVFPKHGCQHFGQLLKAGLHLKQGQPGAWVSCVGEAWLLHVGHQAGSPPRTEGPSE